MAPPRGRAARPRGHGRRAGPGAGEPLILRVFELSKGYGPRTILDGVSFQISEGTVTALVGSNGSGKSTLLRCLAGVTTYRGRVERLAGGPPPRGAIAFLPQSPRLPGRATVGEITDLLAGDRRAARAVALPVERSRRAHTLSGGESQRAALAALIAMRPRLLLLDEPTAELDSAARAEFLARLAELRAAGATIVFSTPAPQASELAAVADRVLVIDGGRLTDHATAEAFLAR